MVSLDGRPGRLDATFRPDDSFTVNLTGPAGWLSSRAFTATLGGVALSVSENGDVLTVVASAAITAAATSPAQFVLTLTGGNDALVGTWSARTDGSAQTSTSAAVIIDSLDVAVTLGGDSADLNAHIADAVGAHAASAVSITDAAGDFTATDVEGALAELQTDLEALPGTYVPLTDQALRGQLLASGEGTTSRLSKFESTTSIGASGTVRLAFFTAIKSETINNLSAISMSTAAAATPTLCKLGLYSVDGSGNLTLVASTANTTSMFAAQNTRYTTATTAPYAKVAGQRYAFAVLVVSGTTMPTVMTVQLAAGNLAALSGVAPRIAAVRTGQTDLPSSIAVGDLADSASFVYGEVLP